MTRIVIIKALDKFIQKARAEIGYKGGANNNNKYCREVNHVPNQAWCATFVVSMAIRSGTILPANTNSTKTLANAFKRINKWHTTKPQIGDIVFYKFSSGANFVDHLGIVERVNSSTQITTIEGNTSSGTTGSQNNGNGVYRRTRNTRLVVGYGRPTFPVKVYGVA